MWLAMVVLGLAACGPTAEEKQSIATLLAADARTTTFNELTYAPLAFPSRTQFIIDGSSPIVEIPVEGRSYARGFELPRLAGEIRLVVRSKFEGGGVFYPMVTVLDAEKRPIFTSRLGAIRSGERWGITLSSEVPVLLAGALRERSRFVLVHTTGHIERAEHETFEPFQVAQRGPVFVPMPSYEGPPRPPRRAATGVLMIELAPPFL